MSERFTSEDGIQLAFDVAGSGPPLLCLAGLSRNMADFEPVVAQVEHRATVIRLDSRGRGASDFADPSTYTIGQEGRDVIALLDHLQIERSAILGTSRGGLIAMALAPTHAHRFSGVLFNDIGPDLAAQGLSPIMDTLGRPPAYRSFEDAADRLPVALGAAFAHVSREEWRTYAKRLWREGERRLELRYDPRLRDAILAHGITDAFDDFWPLYDALAGIPLALLRGENSTLLTRETVAEMARRQPDLIHAEVPDRGHVPFLDEPVSQRTLTQFLDQIYP
ncbi:alpha/beta hydrolase [Celeribacter arenosi]|uniref:Alpha/beta hydrolase n=1 Tax=Celeribacter arenosi TaxID=792649 RepID=A0ABP7K8K6_9RHOB